MDQTVVKARAEEHARATVAGDLRTAASTLTEQARAQAPTVMKQMPGELSDCEITDVTHDGDETVIRIKYLGSGGETTVESRWAEHDGEPMIVHLRVC